MLHLPSFALFFLFCSFSRLHFPFFSLPLSLVSIAFLSFPILCFAVVVSCLFALHFLSLTISYQFCRFLFDATL